MHLYRDGQRQRSRILYVFRTPGGVRVGRDPLEPDVLRQIEAQYPDIVFNWQLVRESQQLIETAAEPRRRRPRREDESADVASPPAVPAPAAAAPAAPAPPSASAPAPPPPPSRIAIPSTIEGATPDERIAFLAHWHPIIRERIPHRTSDPSRQEALNALADRLNPGQLDRCRSDHRGAAAGGRGSGAVVARVCEASPQRSSPPRRHAPDDVRTRFATD